MHDALQLAEPLDPPVEPNPNHHLWYNHGTWSIGYTIHPDSLTKERIRHSLKTKCLKTARQRRDQILRRVQAEGLLALARSPKPRGLQG